MDKAVIEDVAQAIYEILERPIANQDFGRQTRQWELSKQIATQAISVYKEAMGNIKSDVTPKKQQADKRPANCRHRLYDEGKAYPRSGCDGCGQTIFTGLGATCRYENEAPLPSVSP